MPKESEVEMRMREYLTEEGFTVEERMRAQGVDIRASRNGKVYYFEVEGNSKPDGRPLNTSQKYTHLLRAIGQLCLRLGDNPHVVVGLVLPDDVYYEDKVKKLREALNRLSVQTYFVGAEGNVREKTDS